MPSLDRGFLKGLRDDVSKYRCFIETGTLEGGTTFAMEPLFDKLYTIEYSEKFYNIARNKYHGNKIEFILGDSSIEFENLLPRINERAVFFLDGHWSGGDTGKSSKDCPLEEEITHINNLFTHEAIIIIDDFRLFGLGGPAGRLNEDWSNISKGKLLSIVASRLEQVYHLDSSCAPNDRLIMHIRAQ